MLLIWAICHKAFIHIDNIIPLCAVDQFELTTFARVKLHWIFFLVVVSIMTTCKCHCSETISLKLLLVIDWLSLCEVSPLHCQFYLKFLQELWPFVKFLTFKVSWHFEINTPICQTFLLLCRIWIFLGLL